MRFRNAVWLSTAVLQLADVLSTRVGFSNPDVIESNAVMRWFVEQNLLGQSLMKVGPVLIAWGLWVRHADRVRRATEAWFLLPLIAANTYLLCVVINNLRLGLS